MAIKLTTTDEVVHFVNVLVYGASGIGKTVLCSTAPKPLIISVEGGLLSLAGKGIDAFEVENRTQINEVFEWLNLSKEAKRFETVCLDSLSETAEVLLAEELANTKDGRMAYGEMATLMSTTIRAFRDLDKHTVFTAKEKKVVEESTGVTTFMPSVPGQMLLNNLSYFYDEVYRMDFKKVKGTEYRVLNTVGSRRFVAKDRSGKLDPIEQPDLTKVFEKILTRNTIEPQEGK